MVLTVRWLTYSSACRLEILSDLRQHWRNVTVTYSMASNYRESVSRAFGWLGAASPDRAIGTIGQTCFVFILSHLVLLMCTNLCFYNSKSSFTVVSMLHWVTFIKNMKHWYLNSIGLFWTWFLNRWCCIKQYMKSVYAASWKLYICMYLTNTALN